MNVLADKISKRIPHILLVIVILLIHANILKAQKSIVNLSHVDSVQAGIVPMFAYTSDLGFVFGAMVLSLIHI